MTEGQWAYIRGYIRDIADRMGLRDWTLHLRHTPPDEPDAHASTSVTWGRRHGVIWLCTDFADLTPDERRHAVVHELTHWHIDQADSVMRTLEPVIGKAAFAVMESQHKLACENATDAVAHVIAPFMPPCELPDATPSEPAKAKRP